MEVVCVLVDFDDVLADEGELFVVVINELLVADEACHAVLENQMQ